MSYYGSDSQAVDEALEATDAKADESPEGEIGDGGSFGKYCILEGKYKRSCQSCTGIVCNAIKW